MKASFTKVAVFAIMTATGLVAHAENESFPASGRSYNVTWPENARRSVAQIKVIRKGEGTWILAEYTPLFMRPVPPSQPGSPVGDKPLPPPKWEKGPTKEMWINTQMLLDATEVEAEEK
jgi:hypothetical protein